MNREQWLNELAGKIRPLFVNHGAEIPEKIRLTCGWPSKGAFSSKRRTIGECWLKGSSDGHIEIFISPCLSDGVDVAAVLVHELIHASGIKGHGEPFKRLAEPLGLEGPMRATKAGTGLTARLNAMVLELGAYPHGTLDKSQSPHKKDGTRLIKVVCPIPGCGYTVRMAKKWIDVGFPKCGQCSGDDGESISMALAE